MKKKKTKDILLRLDPLLVQNLVRHHSYINRERYRLGLPLFTNRQEFFVFILTSYDRYGWMNEETFSKQVSDEARKIVREETKALFNDFVKAFDCVRADIRADILKTFNRFWENKKNDSRRSR